MASSNALNSLEAKRTVNNNNEVPDDQLDGDGSGVKRKGSDQYSLDDIIYEMESRQQQQNQSKSKANSNSNNNHQYHQSESGVFSSTTSGIMGANEDGAPSSTADLYAQLEQKERDLVLAAELGKALLEKNEDLSRQNERIAEEFSQKLEELEQEKYHLRRRLENAQEEYDIKVHELQQDLKVLQAQLDEASAGQRASEKEKSGLISTLTEQNQRLTVQLKEYAKTEESLQHELKVLRDQVDLKRTSMNEHVSHLDMLREEINMMTQRKADLERRIELLTGEREGLNSTLDESADRIIMLEKQAKEQESIIKGNERVMDELRQTNQALQERLESTYRGLSMSPNADALNKTGSVSLQNEMELSDSERSLNAARRPFSQIDEDEDEDDDIECDNPETLNPVELKELKEEMLSAYQQIKSLSGQLRRREKQQQQQLLARRQQQKNSLSAASTSDGSSSQAAAEDQEDPEGEEEEDEHSSHSSVGDDITNTRGMKPGVLAGAVQEIRSLVHSLLRKESKGACLSCGGDKDEKIRLEVQLHKSTETKEKLERDMKKAEDEAKRKDEEILELKSKLSVTEVQLAAATEERDTLREDIGRTDAGKDELIKKAWEVRDAAVKRKNDTMIELARTRIDVMQINSQLLEAIQQKVELSQQLDQWQADMEELLEEQMMKKLKAAESKNQLAVPGTPNKGATSGNDSDSSAGVERKVSKLLSYFKRS